MLLSCFWAIQTQFCVLVVQVLYPLSCVLSPNPFYWTVNFSERTEALLQRLHNTSEAGAAAAEVSCFLFPGSLLSFILFKTGGTLSQPRLHTVQKLPSSRAARDTPSTPGMVCETWKRHSHLPLVRYPSDLISTFLLNCGHAVLTDHPKDFTVASVPGSF